MIKINFLSSYKSAIGGQDGVALFDEDEQKQIVKEVIKRVLILAIGPLGLYGYESLTIPALNKNKAQIEIKLAELIAFNESKKDTAKEIERYVDEEVRFKAQMDFITKIQEDKLNEYKLFRHLKDSTPPTVWVNSLALTGNTLSILGESINPADIKTFTDKLSNSDFIENLQPLSQTTKGNYQDTGVDTSNFEVKANLKSAVGGLK